MLKTKIILIIIAAMLFACSTEKHEDYYKQLGYNLLVELNYDERISHGPSKATVDFNTVRENLQDDGSITTDLIISVQFLAKEKYGYEAVQVNLDKNTNEFISITLEYGSIK